MKDENNKESSGKEEMKLSEKLKAVPYSNDKVGQASVIGIPAKRKQVASSSSETKEKLDEKLVKYLMEKEGLTEHEAWIKVKNPW